MKPHKRRGYRGFFCILATHATFLNFQSGSPVDEICCSDLPLMRLPDDSVEELRADDELVVGGSVDVLLSEIVDDNVEESIDPLEPDEPLEPDDSLEPLERLLSDESDERDERDEREESEDALESDE